MTPATAEPDTLADVVHDLGDIPLHRILWHPFPGTATEDDQLRCVSGEPKLLAELLDGVLVLKAIGRDDLRDYVPDVVTLADVMDRLGNVPLDRVLWTPRPGTATEADQLRLVDGEPKRLVELVDGILVEKPMGNREGLFAASLLIILGSYVKAKKLGIVAAPDSIMRMTNGRRRLPDLYYTAWERLPTDTAHLVPVADYPPDIAVEILSDGNTRAEMAQKRTEYFASGAAFVWIIDPDTRIVDVYTDPKKFHRLTATDTLTAEPVLPGFVLPLADLFDDPQLNPRPKTS